MSFLIRSIGFGLIVLGVIFIGITETNAGVFENEDITVIFGLLLISIGILLMTR